MAAYKGTFGLLAAVASINFFLLSYNLFPRHHFKLHQVYTKGHHSQLSFQVKPWLKHFSTTSWVDKQKEQLACSIAISNRGRTLLFTAGFRTDRVRYPNCTVNNRTVPGRRVERDVFECKHTSTLHEDDVLSLQLSNGTIIPSLAVWRDRTPLSIGHHPKIPVCIMTQMKNEEGKIADWTEYHIKQGVGLFLVYNNNSTDNTLLELQKYPQVVVVDWPWRKSKNAAILHGFLHMKKVCKWVFHIDVDEYIFPSADNASFTLKEIMHDFPKWVNSSGNVSDSAVVDQVCLRSKAMGTSGYIRCPKLSVPEAYIDFYRWDVKWGKCANRPSHVLAKDVGVHFREVKGKTVWLLWNAAHVVHYTYQCWDDFVLKYDKGRSSAYVYDWKRNKLDKNKPQLPWTKAPGPLDTAFRDYKRYVDKWPLF